jgi:hypothetical protein
LCCAGRDGLRPDGAFDPLKVFEQLPGDLVRDVRACSAEFRAEALLGGGPDDIAIAVYEPDGGGGFVLPLGDPGASFSPTETLPKALFLPAEVVPAAPRPVPAEARALMPSLDWNVSDSLSVSQREAFREAGGRRSVRGDQGHGSEQPSRRTGLDRIDGERVDQTERQIARSGHRLRAARDGSRQDGSSDR